VVHYEQDPPVFGALKEEALEVLRSKGPVPDSVIIPYLLDLNTLNAQAQAIIGRLKREGVTSVVFLGDPLMPRLLTQQATRQDYRPEWIFTGTVFTDTTAVARLYDQSQMAHAFGVSSSPARTAPELSEPWHLYRWWYEHEPTSPRTMLFWGPVVQLLFLGIHMAGPELTAETFAGGLFNYPPTGGTDTEGLDSTELYLGGYLSGDTTPALSFGPRDGDDVDYVAVDDFTTAWWSSTAEGPDENGVVGKGMWMQTGRGLRTPLANPQLPKGVSEDFLFVTTLFQTGSRLAQSVAALGFDDIVIADDLLEEVPRLNVLPEYEPWPESPAADG